MNDTEEQAGLESTWDQGDLGGETQSSEEDFASLNEQLQGERVSSQESEQNEAVEEGEDQQKVQPSRPKGKTIRFKRGEESWEIPEDAIAEIKADKKLQSLMASEMRDKAAGDIAVQNRLRDLAEQRKETESFIKNFNKYSKDDPIKALEFAVQYASKENPDLNFNGFLSGLADQATRLSEMSEHERKSYQLERDLREKDEVLKSHEIERNFNELKGKFLETNDLSSNEFDTMAQTILEDEVLSQGIEKEEDLVEAVSQLYYNVEAQKASYQALRKFVPDIRSGDKKDEAIIINFASILKDNPDFTPKDVEEVVYRAVRGNRKSQASQTLSRKQRSSVSSKKHENDNLSDYEYLEKQLLADRKSQ